MLMLASITFGATLLVAPIHELQDNRATLVLRDKTHQSVTLYVNFTDALHRALGGTRSRVGNGRRSPRCKPCCSSKRCNS
jgi:hypothetical protein